MINQNLKDNIEAALRNFFEASVRLQDVIDSEELDGESLSKNYPFSVSFDDLTVDIKKWIGDTSIVLADGTEVAIKVNNQ